jgi:uncharacterized membrane protein YbhN (UPF0104 family)
MSGIDARSAAIPITPRPGRSLGAGIRRAAVGVHSMLQRHPAPVTTAGCVIVVAALVLALAGKREEFVTALQAAPIWILLAAVVLQLFWLLARSEAWNVCLRAAGATVSRSRLYRAASLGYVGNVFNAQFGIAVRIAALRRSAPGETPRASVLAAAEFPIIIVEAALAALLSFTLVAPLGIPWWVPLLCLGSAAVAIVALGRFARHRREGIWNGLAVMRGLKSRNRVIALVIVTVCAQIGRNWLILNAIGVDASVFDSTALLIGMAVLGLLPVGPSLGAATTVLILGASGVAATAAAGALLTVTAAMGALAFATWALVDRASRWTPGPVPT